MTAADHAPQPPQFREIPSLIYLVKSAEAANRTQMDVLLRDANVTTMQYLALGVLQEHESLSGAALARRAFVRPQSMQDIIRALEAKGYVQRNQISEDRRERVISISRTGEALMKKLEPQIAAFDAALCEGFSDEEEAMFRKLLRRVRTNAETFPF